MGSLKGSDQVLVRCFAELVLWWDSGKVFWMEGWKEFSKVSLLDSLKDLWKVFSTEDLRVLWWGREKDKILEFYWDRHLVFWKAIRREKEMVYNLEVRECRLSD